MAATLHAVHGLMLKAGLREALRFTACLTDGTDLYAFRWASDGRAPTLYWRQVQGNLVVVSEPLDGDRTRWTEVPQGCVLVARNGRPAVLHGLDDAIAGGRAAAVAERAVPGLGGVTVHRPPATSSTAPVV